MISSGLSEVLLILAYLWTLATQTPALTEHLLQGRRMEIEQPRPPSYWKEALTSVSQDGVAFGAMVSFCDSHWAHRVFLLRSCCSVLSVPFLSVQVQLVVWRSLWLWHSLSIKFLDSVCCSVLSGLLLALLLIDCPLQTCVIHSFIYFLLLF